MPAIRQLTQSEEFWIRNAFPEITAHDVAAYLKVHVHTAIRILVRLGLINAPSQKYQQGRSTLAGSNKRKCLVCKVPKTLNKNQYICAKCRCKQREKGLL